jgi:hypothetical protein
LKDATDTHTRKLFFNCDKEQKNTNPFLTPNRKVEGQCMEGKEMKGKKIVEGKGKGGKDEAT